MKKNYSKILVTKVNPSTHEKLKELAEGDRRTLSGLSRIIIEDYVENINQGGGNNKDTKWKMKWKKPSIRYSAQFISQQRYVWRIHIVPIQGVQQQS